MNSPAKTNIQSKSWGTNFSSHTVRIAAFQAVDPSSIPGHRIDDLFQTLPAACYILNRVGKNATFDRNEIKYRFFSHFFLRMSLIFTEKSFKWKTSLWPNKWILRQRQKYKINVEEQISAHVLCSAQSWYLMKFIYVRYWGDYITLVSKQLRWPRG